jgi:hypothetical protein
LKISFSAIGFSMIFCAAYLLAFRYDLGLFSYFPLVGEFHRTPQPEVSGPAIVWYGICTTAVAAALVGGLVVRDDWISAGVMRWIWLVPILTMSLIAGLHRDYFFL